MSTLTNSHKPVPSVFWPLQILVTVMGLCLTYQLVALNAQRVEVNREMVQLFPQYQGAVQVQQKLTALAEDLMKTSADDAAAAQIVKEFQIKVKSDSNSSKTK